MPSPLKRWIPTIFSTSKSSPTIIHSNRHSDRRSQLNHPNGTPTEPVTISNRTNNIKCRHSTMEMHLLHRRRCQWRPLPSKEVSSRGGKHHEVRQHQNIGAGA